MFNKKYSHIIVTTIVLLIWAISLLLSFTRVKFSPYVFLVIIFLILSILLTVISLVKLDPAGRILAITNLLFLSIVSLGGIFVMGIVKVEKCLFWAIVLCISVYLIYFLSRTDTKKLFRGK